MFQLQKVILKKDWRTMKLYHYYNTKCTNYKVSFQKLMLLQSQITTHICTVFDNNIYFKHLLSLQVFKTQHLNYIINLIIIAVLGHYHHGFCWKMSYWIYFTLTPIFVKYIFDMFKHKYCKKVTI